MGNWYYKIEDVEYGPVSISHLKALAQSGELPRDALVRKEADTKWTSADAVPDLFSAVVVSVRPNFARIKKTSQPLALITRVMQSILEGARAIIRDTTSHLVFLAKYANAIWRKRSLARNCHTMTATLGTRMYAANKGAAKIRKQIAALDDRIDSVTAGKGSTKSLKAERLGLAVRLAEPFVTKGPDEDLEPEYSAAIDAKRLVDDHESRLETEYKQILPQEAATRRRVLTGYICSGAVVLACAAFMLASAEVDMPMVSGVNDQQIGSALGFVVCGISVIEPDGGLQERGGSMGTCFVVSEDGYLLTNKHVIEEIQKLQRADLLREKMRSEGFSVTPKVWVFFGKEQKHLAEIVHVSTDHDLAILKIEAVGLPVFQLASINDIPRTTKVYACGFPGAAQSPLSVEEVMESVRRDTEKSKIEKRFKLRDFEFVTTSGTVSRTTSEKDGRRWIQHNADINPGNSGGPLVTENGHVVAINTLANVEASGVFYSLAIAQLRQELEKVIPGLAWD